eukprot:1185255-Prorocentrum_minimum.AAC.1
MYDRSTKGIHGECWTKHTGPRSRERRNIASWTIFDKRYPSPFPGYPSPLPGHPSTLTGYPSTLPGYPSPFPGYPSPLPGYAYESVRWRVMTQVGKSGATK